MFKLALIAVALAASPFTINSYPTSVVSGKKFVVLFSGAGLSPNTNYNVKALGGDSQTEADTWSDSESNWLQQNTAWVKMPVFTTNSEGSASGSIKARFEESSSGPKDFFLRAQKTGSSEQVNTDHVTIIVSQGTPSPSPTASPSPTTTDTPAPTYRPTPHPTPSTPDTSESDVLAARNELYTPTPSESPSPSPEAASEGPPVLPVVFIVGGLGFLGAGSYPFIKRKLAKYNESYPNVPESKA